MTETKQLFVLLAELARAAAQLEGGTHESVLYTASQWRAKLEDIAKRAERLASQEGEG